MDYDNKDNLFAQISGQFLVAAVIGSVAFGAYLAFWLVPYAIGAWFLPTENQQIGFRGTGMNQIEYTSDLAALEEANVPPFPDEPFIPEPGEELAGDIYENVQVLGHLTDANFNRLMAAMTEWVSPEQGCGYCHSNLENMAEDNYAKVVARSMIQMNWSVNENWSDHVNAADGGQIGVTCYTCHRGNNVPQYVWYEATPIAENVGPSAAYQNRGSEVVGYASLPVDAIERYLLNYEQISVSSYAPREPNEGTADIKHTERTYALMMHFSQSLGVGCTYCHNSRAFYDIDQSPPTRNTAQLGIGMVQEINNDWILPNTDILPEMRLGEKGDAPKAYCMTCHQGAPQPLLGHNVIADWPELASETPVYEAATQ
ncbi:MAG: photosynthetic reaction center cytochrome PufC [Pseudomonadota bacterium]